VERKPQTCPVARSEHSCWRKLAQFDGGKKIPATISAIEDAVRWAEEIMKAMDERFPSRPDALD
jgi:hypothetical protein